jgi:predicted esterase
MSHTPLEHHIPVTRTARYHTLGQPGRQVRHLWYVLHGYGQLSAYFIRHFEAILDAETLVVAPEGLSLFYLPPGWNRVGATWMTKEKRQSEIEDYIAYLNQVHAAVMEIVPEDVMVTVLGFSQGATTAWRWVRAGGVQPRHMINWAGAFPEDSPEQASFRLPHTDLYYVSSSEDEYVNAEAAAKMTDAMQHLGQSLRTYHFEGNHRLDEAIIQAINTDILRA